MYGRTIYDQAGIKATTEKLKDPEWAATIVAYHQHLNTEEYPQSYVDIIFQKWERPPDIYDAYSFSQVHTEIRNGHYALFQILVKDLAPADKEILLANHILNELSHPFYGEFWGGTADYDGVLGWKCPINAIINTGSKNGVGFTIIPPDEVPLEVGYISAHKTLVLLRGEAVGLARWPYGQQAITVLMPAWKCVFADDEMFQELKQEVWGNFDTLPNPYDEWNKHKRDA